MQISFENRFTRCLSEAEEDKKVTRVDNIVADGWALWATQIPEHPSYYTPDGLENRQSSYTIRLKDPIPRMISMH